MTDSDGTLGLCEIYLCDLTCIPSLCGYPRALNGYMPSTQIHFILEYMQFSMTHRLPC